MKILFLGTRDRLDPWYSDVLQKTEGRWNIELFDVNKPLADQFRGAAVVVDQGGGHGTRERIDMALHSGVKLWQVLGTGLDHTDVDYFHEKKFPLANTPGPFSAAALAEHALFLILHFAKNFAESQRSLQARVLCQPMNEELTGKTLGLVGLGASGQELAKRASALGMRIMAMDTYPVSQEKQRELNISFFGGADSLDKLLRESDYLSLHVPLTVETRHLIGREALLRMKPSAVLINVARGGIVDEGALQEALSKNQLRGAGLDVFSEEPVDPNHPLLRNEKVVATPHVAGVTFETSRRRAEAVVTNIERISNGQPPLFQVVPPDQDQRRH